MASCEICSLTQSGRGATTPQPYAAIWRSRIGRILSWTPLFERGGRSTADIA